MATDDCDNTPATPDATGPPSASGGRTYNYDPSKLREKGVDRMRFELGDTTFAPGELTAALCDEEYQALLDEHKTWESAKIECLRAILMKFSHQVTMSVNGLSYSFSDRIAVWHEMLKAAEAGRRGVAPRSTGPLGCSYFYADMLGNPRKG